MNHIRHLRSFTLAVLVLACAAATASAAEPALAVVNGVSIPNRLMDRSLQAHAAQGQADSPALRASLREELVSRELLAQEALRRGLDKRPEVEDALRAVRQNVLLDALLQDELARSPVSDAELKTEYERQVKLLSAGELQQYQMATIVLDSEADARAVMAALRSGQAFDAQARSRSLDPSRERGGELGWLLPDQVTPALSNVMVNLAPGAVAAAPIQVGRAWHVLKVLGKRPFQAPAFEDSRSQLQAAVVQNRRAALLKRLSDGAKITR